MTPSPYSAIHRSLFFLYIHFTSPSFYLRTSFFEQLGGQAFGIRILCACIITLRTKTQVSYRRIPTIMVYMCTHDFLPLPQLIGQFIPKRSKSCVMSHMPLPAGLNVPDVRRPDDGANAACIIVQEYPGGVHISPKKLEDLPRCCCCAWFVLLAHPP